MDDTLNSPQILKVLKRIEIIHDARFDEYFPKVAEAEVRIITKKGDTYLSGRVKAKGDWDNPLSEKELKDKFYWLAEQVKSTGEAGQIVEVVENLENFKDLDLLFRLL